MLSGQVFGFARRGACGPELFLQRRKSECLQSIKPQEVCLSFCTTPLGGDDQGEGEQGSHENPTLGLMAQGWAGQGGEETKLGKKMLQQWRLQPGTLSSLRALQGRTAITVHSWGLQHWAVGRSLVPKYSLWLGCFLGYRI